MNIEQGMMNDEVAQTVGTLEQPERYTIRRKN